MENYDKKFDDKLRSITSIYYAQEDQVRQDKITFKSYLDQFEDYPMLVVEQSDLNRLRSAYDIDLNAIFAARCKENRWVHIPIVFDGMMKYTMTVPVNRRTPQLVASLLLVANQPRSGLNVTAKTRQWSFSFYGDPGKTMLDTWIEQCKRDSLYQMILGFYPKGDDYNDDHED